MLTGKRFKLKVSTLGIETIGTHREAVQVPANEIVVVTSGPRHANSRMLDVLWNGRALLMFVEDVQARGRELDHRSGKPISDD